VAFRGRSLAIMRSDTEKIMNTYKELKELSKTRKRKLANNTYLVVRDDGGFGIRLHYTEVVIHYKDKIVLNTDGWFTNTTKSRINEFSPFNVYQKNYQWFIDDGIPYKDNIALKVA
jgi:hypothetical protein